MSVRLVVTITAVPGKGTELAQAFVGRCEECRLLQGEDSGDALVGFSRGGWMGGVHGNRIGLDE